MKGRCDADPGLKTKRCACVLVVRPVGESLLVMVDRL